MATLHGKPIDRRTLSRVAGDISAAGGVRLVELGDGAERGIRVLEFRTGTGLSFELLVDRAMDVGNVEHSGRNIGWHSPTGFRHPGLHEYADEHGLSWLRSFSGLLVTGGLDHTLFMEDIDASNYRYALPTLWHPLHGRVSNIPAKLLGYGETWTDDGRCVLWAEGETRQARVFAEHLRLIRRVEADLGGNDIRLRDVVVNAGSDSTPHMMLYHIDVGWPLLDAGARFLAPIDHVRWSSGESVVKQRISYQSLPSPAAGLAEQGYEHVLIGDESGQSLAAIVNDELALGLQVSWNLNQFPCFFEWMHLRDGAYTVGMEPSTHHIEGNQAARDDGSMIWLSAGEERHYDCTLTVVDGSQSIASTEQQIRALAGQPTDAEVQAFAQASVDSA